MQQGLSVFPTTQWGLFADLRNGSAAARRAALDILITPILEGNPEPSLDDLGRTHGVTEKQAANHLLTAKRAYQRLMKDEIRLYAVSEAAVADEVRTLFRILGKQA